MTHSLTPEEAALIQEGAYSRLYQEVSRFYDNLHPRLPNYGLTVFTEDLTRDIERITNANVVFQAAYQKHLQITEDLRKQQGLPTGLRP